MKHCLPTREGGEQQRAPTLPLRSFLNNFSNFNSILSLIILFNLFLFNVFLCCILLLRLSTAGMGRRRLLLEGDRSRLHRSHRLFVHGGLTHWLGLYLRVRVSLWLRLLFCFDFWRVLDFRWCFLGSSLVFGLLTVVCRVEILVLLGVSSGVLCVVVRQIALGGLVEFLSKEIDRSVEVCECHLQG